MVPGVCRARAWAVPQQTRKGESLYRSSFQQSLKEWVGFGIVVSGCRLSGQERGGGPCHPVGLMGRKGLALGGDSEEYFPFFLGWNPESPRFRNEKKAHSGPLPMPLSDSEQAGP